jgi:predicted nuclease of restriction endonuclease-like (RecB) superfamily
MVQAPLAPLPWYHHIALLDKLSTAENRLWYAARAIEHGWSHHFLRRRMGKSVTSFQHTSPPCFLAPSTVD